MSECSKYTLLVVDDEEILRNSIVFDFKRKGFTVLSAGTADAAFSIVQSQRVDLVISDFRMPGGDGLDLLEKIRQIDPKVPIVIFLTGFADITEEECLAKGAQRVITKPFDRKTLMQSVLSELGATNR